MLRLYILALFILGHSHAFSQTHDLDSLKSKLGLAKEDTIIISLYNNIGNSWLSIQQDSAHYYLSKAEALAGQKNYRYGQAINLNYWGRYYSSIGQFDKAAEYFLKCLTVTEYSEQSKIQAVTHYDLGMLYATLRTLSSSDELFDKQISYFKKSIHLFDQISSSGITGDMRLMKAAAYTEIGRAYTSRRIDSVKLDTALYYFNKGLQEAEKIRSRQIMFQALDGIGNIHIIRKQDDLALAVGYRLKKIADGDRNNLFLTSMALMKLGNFYTNVNFDSAQYYLLRCEETYRKMGPDFFSFLIAINSQLGQLHLRYQKYEKAIMYFEREQQLSKQNGTKDIQLSYLLTAEAYRSIGNFKKAFEFQVRYTNLKDSLLNVDTSAKLARLQSEFESARQKDNIALLQKEAEVKELLLNKRQNQKIIIASGALLLILIMGILFYRSRLLQISQQEQVKLYKEVDQLKSRFFANISHEFRTPLTLLLGPIEKRLAEATLPQDRTEFTVMHRNASRLLKLVNQLLELSRFEARTIRLQASSGNVVQTIIDTMSEFQSIANSKNISFQLLSCEAVEIYYEPEKLEQVFNNLFSNAFKSTPEGGEITVDITLKRNDPNFKNGAIQITIQDNGIGIAPEHLPKLFDRFYQVDSSSTRAYDGTGIGLALTKELIELHRGKIEVSSTEGKGTAFTILLPIGSAHLKENEIVTSSTSKKVNIIRDEENLVEEPESHHGELILIIEDNQDLREHLKRELAVKYNILLANNGVEGVRLATEQVPSLIISDLMMPEKDGLEVCQMLKQDQRTSHIPIILLTAKAEVESRLQGFQYGADDYITKPFSIPELQVRIQNIIDNRKRIHEKIGRHYPEFRPSPIAAESTDEKFIKKAIAIIERNIDDPQFSVEVFAGEIGMSTVQLYRKLTALTNYSPNEFIRHLRLQRAADLLKKRAGNVAEIAYQCGFNNLSYFSKVFKEKYGKTPSEYTKTFQS